MNNHTDVLNQLAKEINAQFYLEIGISDRSKNFDRMAVPYKIGVDPNPRALANYQCDSDEFFGINRLGFDLIFIDGLHHADQVRRDFENALAVLHDGGYVVLHDTNPEREDITHVPRDKKGRWLGDVYKFAVTLGEYPGIQFKTYPFDNGITVVWKDPEAVELLPGVLEVSWEYFDKNRKRLLRLV